MSELYLIAHKVRGEAAFDIAERMRCPACKGDDATYQSHCYECDDEGFWWIVSTSGHRAYPYWNLPLDIRNLDEGHKLVMDHNEKVLTWTIFEMPPDLPDHYPTRAAKPSPSSGKNLLAALGLLPKIARRL